MADSKRKQYRVIDGLDWYGDNRAEPGEIRNDIPRKSIPWLLEGGHIEEYQEPDKKGAKDK